MQIHNESREGGYIERKKTGSLYGVRNTYKPLVQDGEWFTMNVSVNGRRITEPTVLQDGNVIQFAQGGPKGVPSIATAVGRVENGPPIVGTTLERSFPKGVVGVVAHRSAIQAGSRYVCASVPRPEQYGLLQEHRGAPPS